MNCTTNAICFLGTSFLALQAGSAANAGEMPNVLMILVDDLKPAIGCYGDGKDTEHRRIGGSRGAV